MKLAIDHPVSSFQCQEVLMKTRRSSLLALRIALAGLIAAAAAAAPRIAEAQPAFPGAEGFGAAATGGRGGQVIKVTTLAASGPGSLQEALDQPGPRIIVFTVSGVIDADILFDSGDVTIAGQTAPGAGITIRGQLFGPENGQGNIIARHLRIRPRAFSGGDGAQYDGMRFAYASTLIFDHISVSWGLDETFDLYESQDVTVQWSTIEEAATVGHPEGEHNYGLINGPDGHRIALHHNLFIHNKNRNPAVANGPAEIRNNVVYNVRHGFVHHNPASGQFNIVGNTYIQGPNDDLIPFFFDDENAMPVAGLGYYLADNFIDDPGDFVGVVDNPWSMPFQHPSFENLYAPETLRSATEFDFSQVVPDYIPVTTQSSAAALALVLEKSGGLPRDVVTRRVLGELEARGGEWGMHEPADLLEGLTPGTPPTDADDDGMADAWELENGLDPTDGSDHDTVTASGYTAIEDYINGLASDLDGGVPGTGGAGGGGGSGNGSGGGATGSGGASSGTQGAGAGAGNGGPGADVDGDDSGCGCVTAGGSSDLAHGGALAMLLALGVLRRRRRGMD